MSSDIDEDKEEAIEEAILVGLIEFHGMNLHVFANGSTKYIRAKDLVDAIGLDWRSAKRSLNGYDNAILFGLRTLKPPKIAGSRGTRTPSLYMELSLSRGWIMKLSLANFRSKGKSKQAVFVRNLQLEWSNAINDYEEEGMALKGAKVEGRKGIGGLLMALNRAKDPTHKAALSRLVDEHLEELGIPVDRKPLKRPERPPYPMDPDYDRWKHQIGEPDEMGLRLWNCSADE